MRKVKLNLKRSLCGFLAAVMAAVIPIGSLPLTAAAASEGSESGTVTESYVPCHIALVMDRSGSIEDSDPNEISKAAAKNLITRLPMKDNMVSVYSFSSSVKTDAGLSSVDGLDNGEKLTKVIDDVVEPGGYTHMLEAIKKAREDLEKNNQDGIENLIIVFTDGAEWDETKKTFYPDNYSTATKSEIAEKVKESVGSGKTRVYCVGFDYVDDDGTHSLTGSDGTLSGFGYKLLKEVADQTKGDVIIKNTAEEISQAFDEILKRICYSEMKPVGKIKPDGSKHELEFDIGSSVVEASIRLKSNDPSLMKKAIAEGDKIKLVQGGKEITFKDGGKSSESNIWYYADNISAIIKLNEPAEGKWKLVIDKIKSDYDVEIDLVQNFNMSINADFEVNGKTAEKDTAWQYGDTFKIKAKFVSEGKEVSDGEAYSDPNLHAYAFIASEPLPKYFVQNHTTQEINDEIASKLVSGKKFDLKSTGTQLESDSLKVDWTESVVIGIFAYSDNYKCYCFKTIEAEDDFFVTEPPEITLKMHESFVIENITSYSSRPGVTVDSVAASAVFLESDCVYDKNTDSITVTGRMKGQTQLRLTLRSPGGKKTKPLVFNINITGTVPVFKLPDDKKSLSVPVGGSVKLSDLLGYASDEDGDPLELRFANSNKRTEEKKFTDVDDLITAEMSSGGIEFTCKNLEPKFGKDAVDRSVEYDVWVTDGTNSTPAEKIKITIASNQAIDDYNSSIAQASRDEASKSAADEAEKTRNMIIIIIASVLAAAIIAALIAIMIKRGRRRVYLTLNNVKLITYNNEMLDIISSFDIKQNYPSSTSVTLSDIIKNLISNTQANPDGQSVLNEIFTTYGLDAAAGALIFEGCSKRGNYVKIQGSAPNLCSGANPDPSRKGSPVNDSVSDSFSTELQYTFFAENDAIIMSLRFSTGKSSGGYPGADPDQNTGYGGYPDGQDEYGGSNGGQPDYNDYGGYGDQSGSSSGGNPGDFTF